MTNQVTNPRVYQSLRRLDVHRKISALLGLTDVYCDKHNCVNNTSICMAMNYVSYRAQLERREIDGFVVYSVSLEDVTDNTTLRFEEKYPLD